MEPMRLAYVAVFGGAALLCLGLVPRTRVVSDTDTRRSLAGLLAVSGAWAGLAVAQVLVDTPAVKTGLYTAGLAVGLAAVLAWLAFCSAYAGARLHRNRTVGAVAVSLYLVVVAVKFTNPIHGAYFSATLASTPFPHLVIDRLAVDWIVTAAAYVAAGYGFLLLRSALDEAEYGTTSLWVVVGLAALPVAPSLLTTVGAIDLLDLGYESVGVALFAVGALYFTTEQFEAVGRYGYTGAFDALGEAVIVLDADGRIQRANRAAVELFPALGGVDGQRLGTVVPALSGAPQRDVVTVDRDGEERHFVHRSTSLEVGANAVGTAIVLGEVTELERKRRELERQNEQLDDFAAAVDHELRNTVGIAAGYTELARDRLSDDPAAEDALDVVEETLERMRGISEDLSTLARHGQTVSRTAPCHLAAVARRAWRGAGGADADLDLLVENGAQVRADQPRLLDLLTAAFDFALTEGATRVRLELDGTTIAVTADCDPVPADRVDDAFAYDAAVPSAEAGMLLPNVRTLAAVHGWAVDLDPTYTKGVRLEITGVEGATPSGRRRDVRGAQSIS